MVILATAIMLSSVLSFVLWFIAQPQTATFEDAGSGQSPLPLILLLGGLFLLYKGTHEIHNSVEGGEAQTTAKVGAGLAGVIGQIIVLDLVFSIDSVITAVGMVEDLAVMIAAVIIAMAVMIAASGPIARFIEKHPTTKMLALSFLMLVGVALVADGLHFHIPRGYIYFAVFFSAAVEALNLVARAQRKKTAG